MDPILIKQTLIKVLQDIQSSSGLACPKLVGATKPVDDVPEFDSKMWPVAVGMLAQALGVSIADDVNLFREDHTHNSLTLDQTVTKILDVAQPAIPPTSTEVAA